MTQGYTKALPLDADVNLTANSDQLAVSQKAVKTYIDNKAVDIVTHAATSKTTPVDTDELPIVDSAASNILKKITWSNLKATLKTYFDTLYPSGDSSAWTSWTPTWTNITIGNGTVTAKYKQIGKTVFARVSVTGGSTSSGNGGAVQQISLPVPAASQTVYAPLGHGAWNTGAVVFPYAPYYNTANAAYLMWIATGAVSGATVVFSSTGPNLAAGHTISLFFCYEVA